MLNHLKNELTFEREKESIKGFQECTNKRTAFRLCAYRSKTTLFKEKCVGRRRDFAERSETKSRAKRVSRASGAAPTERAGALETERVRAGKRVSAMHV